MLFGETSAATAGTLTNELANQAEVGISTATASTAAPVSIIQGSVTATTGPPALQIQTTWNNASLTGEGILFNATNTSSTGSKLIDLRVGNTSEFTVGTSGLATLGTATCTTVGTAGGMCPAEGTAPTNVSGSDALYADSTVHELMAAERQHKFRNDRQIPSERSQLDRANCLYQHRDSLPSFGRGRTIAGHYPTLQLLGKWHGWLRRDRRIGRSHGDVDR